ncbi:hypothetical protein V2I01_03495 [Micromonospora sp. BRA006-A]|nr:hypothetical protein [Micromonospora sp. BRA006-A]
MQVYGGHDPDALLAARTLTADVDPADLTGVLAGFTGFFLDGARRPHRPASRRYGRSSASGRVPAPLADPPPQDLTHRRPALTQPVLLGPARLRLGPARPGPARPGSARRSCGFGP